MKCMENTMSENMHMGIRLLPKRIDRANKTVRYAKQIGKHDGDGAGVPTGLLAISEPNFRRVAKTLSTQKTKRAQRGLYEKCPNMSGRMCNEVYANLDKLYASALEGVTDEGLRLSLLAQAKTAFNIRDVLAMLRSCKDASPQFILKLLKKGSETLNLEGGLFGWDNVQPHLRKLTHEIGAEIEMHVERTGDLDLTGLNAQAFELLNKWMKQLENQVSQRCRNSKKALPRIRKLAEAAEADEDDAPLRSDCSTWVHRTFRPLIMDLILKHWRFKEWNEAEFWEEFAATKDEGNFHIGVADGCCADCGTEVDKESGKCASVICNDPLYPLLLHILRTGERSEEVKRLFRGLAEYLRTTPLDQDGKSPSELEEERASKERRKTKPACSAQRAENDPEDVAARAAAEAAAEAEGAAAPAAPRTAGASCRSTRRRARKKSRVVDVELSD